MCGYRLIHRSSRIVKVRPSFHGWRFGVWVVVQPETQPSKHWDTSWTRFVSDPIELYLIRSAVAWRADETPQEQPQPVRRSRPQQPQESLLDRDFGEVEALLS